jgi:hypothetical protein
MPIFKSETELRRSLDEHDLLIRQCLSGDISFSAFIDLYDSYYCRAALDGHESDNAELVLFGLYKERIEVHRVIAEEILSTLCSDSDAEVESYKLAGRFGSKVAQERMRALVSEKNGALRLSEWPAPSGRSSPDEC